MNDSEKQDSAEVLDNKGLRKTTPRMLILSALLEAGEPLSQEQIAQRIAGKGVNKTTIYRTLASLVEANVIHEAVVRERIQYYETAAHCKEHICHPHFTCRKCQKTICLTEADIPPVSLPAGFIQHHQKIQIDGICSTCNSHSE